MAAAEVGDASFGEDPTVLHLEGVAADLLDCDRAVFMPSGTMANHVALLLRSVGPGGVVCPERAHIAGESTRLERMLHLQSRVNELAAPAGLPDAGAIRTWVEETAFMGEMRLLCLENSHNLAGGTVLPAGAQGEILDIASKAGVACHLDGARLFNAAVASGCAPRDLAFGFSTVMISLSKGLGAPAGSLLCLSKEDEVVARQSRKTLGGAMRQVGSLAAAGLIALEEGPRGLPRDHALASALAQGLAHLGSDVHVLPVSTNLVFAKVPDSRDFVRRLQARGVLAKTVDCHTIRFATHRDIREEDITTVLEQVEILHDTDHARGASLEPR